MNKQKILIYGVLIMSVVLMPLVLANNILFDDGTNVDLWTNLSEQGATFESVNGQYHFKDNITTYAQAKAYRTPGIFGNATITMNITLVNVSTSYNMDRLEAPSDDGYGNTTDVADSNINESGFSIPIIHRDLPLRLIYTFVKAQNYSTSGLSEIWVVRTPSPATYFGFYRVWQGTDVVYGEEFNLKTDYYQVNDTAYNITIAINGTRLINNVTLGMNSTFPFSDSIGFQAKGTAENITEAYVNDISIDSITNPVPPSSITGIAKAYNSSNQANLISSEYTKVNFNTEEIDPNNEFSNSSYSAPETGYYVIQSQLYYYYVQNGRAYCGHIYKNGISVYQSCNSASTTGLYPLTSVELYTLLYLNATDTIEIYARPLDIGNASALLTGATGVTQLNIYKIK